MQSVISVILPLKKKKWTLIWITAQMNVGNSFGQQWKKSYYGFMIMAEQLKLASYYASAFI